MAVTTKELEYIKKGVEGSSHVNSHLKHIHNRFIRLKIDKPEFWIVGFDEEGNTVTYDGGHDTYEDAEDSVSLLNPLGRGSRSCYQIIKVFPKVFED